jgi:hypothetical protein
VSAPTNSARAQWAGEAVRVFMTRTACDLEDSLGDLVCDLMHSPTNAILILPLRSIVSEHYATERSSEELDRRSAIASRLICS